MWEALVERLTRKLGNVVWIVDVNRQSLDRVIPGIRAWRAGSAVHRDRLAGLKYGGRTFRMTSNALISSSGYRPLGFRPVAHNLYYYNTVIH